MIEAAVSFFEQDLPEDGPLYLRTVRGRPVLWWTLRRLHRDGASRAFLSAPPAYRDQILACVPDGMSVTVSDRHDALMSFLEADGLTAVLPRAALPFAAAGPGMAYAAPGPSLAETWRVRLTNAVQDAQLLPGWIPIFGPETLDELDPLFDPAVVETDAP